MITYVYGDIFSSPAKVLVNPVNTVGTMGSGLAHDFKRFYPEMYDLYREQCEMDQFTIGQLMLYRTPHKWVLNFPTKKHWRANARTDYIEAGLQKFATQYANLNITSISFPALGTGRGKLDWQTEVRPLMEAYLVPLPIMVYVHLFDENDRFYDDKRNIRALRAWLNGQPKSLSFDAFWKRLEALANQTPDMQTLDETQRRFRISATARKGRQRASIKITPTNEKPIFIPETSLTDLWQYIQRAGYIMPQNLPNGLDDSSDYVIALLSQLDILQPVHLALVGGFKVIGLNYVPPLKRKPDTYTIIFESTNE